MPLSYQINENQGAVIFTGTGVLTDDGMYACIKEMRHDQRLKPGMPRLSDMREVKEFKVTGPGYQKIISLMQETSSSKSTARNAVLVSSGPGDFMGRMFSVMNHGQSDVEFRVFHDIQAAHDWLGL